MGLKVVDPDQKFHELRSDRDFYDLKDTEVLSAISQKEWHVLHIGKAKANVMFDVDDPYVSSVSISR